MKMIMLQKEWKSKKELKLKAAICGFCYLKKNFNSFSDDKVESEPCTAFS